MMIKIIGITKKNGEVVPDPDNLVAEVNFEKDQQKVNVDVYNPKYEKSLQQLFSHPHHRISSGFTTPQGSVFEGIEEFQPWDPEVMKVVGNKLFALGLRFVVVGDTKKD